MIGPAFRSFIRADKPNKLSDTARAVLTLATTRDDHLIRPLHLPIAAVRQVARSLLKAGLAEEIASQVDDEYVWRISDGDRTLMLRATGLGPASAARKAAAEYKARPGFPMLRRREGASGPQIAD
jgi:hypothetical protein